MTDNNAAKQILSASEREDVFERHFSHDHPNGRDILDLMLDLESALLSKLRAPVADERAQQRNEGFASLSLWWTMTEAEAELIGKPIKDDRPILSFMGSGASHQVTAGDIRAALASAPVAKPKRAPLDDWRVQAIADCLETEWDEMSPDLAESYARTIVGHLIEYEKESDRIEAQHAAEPVHPVVQAVRKLRASAPVAGEAQVSDYRRGVMDAFHLANMANANRQGRTAEETCAHLVRSLADLANGDAAPQASEAVRDAEDAARWRWATASDGNADKLCAIVLCHGGYQDKINERADFYRAALSAQPGAQNDEN